MDANEVIRSIRRPKKIAICTTWGSPFSWTSGVYNMMNLIRPEGIEYIFLPGHGRDPARRHMWGAERALAWGATHMCFLGTDQIHDLDILVKFVKHIEDGWPAVTALVPCRGQLTLDSKVRPFVKVAYAWRYDDERRENVTLSIKHLKPVYATGGNLMEIAVVGSGAMMFDMECIKAMERPWFRELPADVNSWKPACMDTLFCFRLVTEGGARLLLDTTIEVKHLDVFEIDGTYEGRFHDWPEKNKEPEYIKDHVSRYLQQPGHNLG